MDRNRLLLAVAVLVHAVFARWQFTGSAFNIDYLTLWSVPHAISAAATPGTAPDIYDPAVQRRIGDAIAAEAARPGAPDALVRAASINAGFYHGRVDATGTPFVYALVGLTATRDFVTDVQRFQLFAAACFLAAMAVWCRLLRFTAAGILLAVSFFGSIFGPMLMDIAAGNINQIQLLTLAIFVLFATRGRFLAAGAAIGIGLAIKPNIIYVPLVAVTFLVADRQFARVWRLLAGMGVSLAAAAVVGAVYFKSAAVWLKFLATVPGTLSGDYTLSRGNYGLVALVAAVTGTRPGFGVEALLTAAMAALCVVIARRPRAEAMTPRDQAFLTIGLGGALLVLASGLAWIHYYVLLIPAALFLLRAEGGDTPAASKAVFAITLVALCLMGDFQNYIGALGASIAVNAATLLLVAGLIIDTVRRTALRAAVPAGRRRGVS